MAVRATDDAFYGNAAPPPGRGGDRPPWLHGKLERKDVEMVFASAGNTEGTFLVRESTRNAGDYVLSLMFEGKVQHYIIVFAGDMFNIDDGPQFGTLDQLIQYYQLNLDRLPSVLGAPIPRADAVSAPPPLPAAGHRASGGAQPPLPPASYRTPSGIAPLLPGARGGAGAGAMSMKPVQDSLIYGDNDGDDTPPLPPPPAGRGAGARPVPSAQPQMIYGDEGDTPPLPPPPAGRGGAKAVPHAQPDMIYGNEDSAPAPPLPGGRGKAAAPPPAQDLIYGDSDDHPLPPHPVQRQPSGTRGAPPPPPPEDDEPLPPQPRGGPSPLKSTHTTVPAPAPAAAAAAGRGVIKGKNGMVIPEAREKLAAVPRVKKWLDAAQDVNQQHIEVLKEENERKLPEGFTQDAVRTAAQREESFLAAALAEEKMYLLWLNRQRKAMGKPEVKDISVSLQDGIIMMEVLTRMSGDTPPMYARRVTVVQQAVDNWHVIVKFMRKMGMQVDNVGNDPQAENIGLDPALLHSLDRREILKLFSKLLIFESQ